MIYQTIANQTSKITKAIPAKTVRTNIHSSNDLSLSSQNVERFFSGSFLFTRRIIQFRFVFYSSAKSKNYINCLTREDISFSVFISISNSDPFVADKSNSFLLNLLPSINHNLHLSQFNRPRFCIN